VLSLGRFPGLSFIRERRARAPDRSQRYPVAVLIHRSLRCFRRPHRTVEEIHLHYKRQDPFSGRGRISPPVLHVAQRQHNVQQRVGRILAALRNLRARCGCLTAALTFPGDLGTKVA
jgi:hypothetical protein